ncbi:hypothetical protein MMC13_001512 [Lambiella insularis]|nr:hypothetical protein [Lambiella insularis]
MPRAEVGSTKFLNNKLKSKGLQRLRWYCQGCERQMRDENGFKMHTQSESHVRRMLLIGEDPRKHIADFSAQFQRDFLQLLRTSHGEKKININHFYQEYISNKEHVHMNATKWPSLTEYAKFLGREGICRVEEGEKGLEVAWIDNSPEALRRQDAIRKKERQDRGDEEREQKLIREQIERARRDAEEKEDEEDMEDTEDTRALLREDGEKIKLAFSGKAVANKPASPFSTAPVSQSAEGPALEVLPSVPAAVAVPATTQEKVSLKMGLSNKPKNVFAAASKKNALGGNNATAKAMPQKHMSEAERIMKEEIEQKRLRETKSISGPGFKRQRLA